MPRFARGFVLSEARSAPPMPGWSSEMALGLHLARAPEVPVTRAEHAGSSVVVLGHFVDTGRWLSQAAAVAAAAGALARSESEFLDLTDAWSGRYLVLFGNPHSRRVMTDAAGMRSAFHTLDGPFVLASHARLVADIVGAPPSPVADAYRAVRQAQRQRGPLPMPGRSTPWAGVVSLTANVALEVEGRRLRRIFPRGGLPAMDAPSAAAAIGPRLRGQVETLVASGRPVALSVTAGRDSRVSLAASRPCRDAIQYFTYAGVGPAGNDWDVTTARSMSAALGLSHLVLELTGVDDAPGLRQALSEASILSHSAEVVGAYRRSFPGDTIHIRSNIFEIARSYYRRKASGMAMPTSPRALTPAQLASLWGRRAPVSPLVVEAFDEWMQAVGFTDVTEIDGLDMFYWEHRMAGWHGNVVLESDFAFDSHVLFNARTILRDMLAVPADDRARSTVSEQLVADLWPELQRWPYKDPTGTRPPGRPPAGSRRHTRLWRRISRVPSR